MMEINLSAPINTLGYGIIGLNLLDSLVKSGNEVTLWPLPSAQNVEAHPDKHEIIKQAIGRQSTYNVNAPSVRHWHQFDLAQHVGKGLHVGSTVFELNRFTSREIHHLNSQDAICVPTQWAENILRENGINKPIGILPHGVDRSIFHEGITPQLRDKNQTVFINCGKFEIRKGHDVLVEAFNKAFEQSDNVQLIMACHNPFYSEAENNEWKQIYKQSKLGNKITVVEGRFPVQQDIAKLMATADCGVFPARAEGWGLESFEMMSLGKQVILTNYAGHTGYATHENSLLVEIEDLEDAYDGKWFHGQGQWASIGDSQLEQLVSHMRSIHAKKQNATLGLNMAGIETAKSLSWDNAVGKLVKFLEDLS